MWLVIVEPRKLRKEKAESMFCIDMDTRCGHDMTWYADIANR